MLRIGSPSLQPRQAQFDTCLDCKGRLVRFESFLNARTDTLVRVYKCGGCQRLVWDD
jgi:uncharacterized protein with PIN domain